MALEPAPDNDAERGAGLTQMTLPEPGSAASSILSGPLTTVPAPMQRRVVENPDVLTIPLRTAQLLQDSLRRAKEAARANSRHCDMQATAFRNEAAVIDQAERVLDLVIREHSA